MKQIVGILLAAGSSRRFGADKRLHPLADGTPMILASARRLAAVCSHTLVVIRPDDSALNRLLGADGLTSVVCEQAALGMGHSLSCGVAASADAEGWLLALADMPFIRPASYHAILTALDEGASIARPTYQGNLGHPVGFGAAHRFELLALTGDQGGKTILDAHADALRHCPVDDPGVTRDIDEQSPLEITTH